MRFSDSQAQRPPAATRRGGPTRDSARPKTALLAGAVGIALLTATLTQCSEPEPPPPQPSVPGAILEVDGVSISRADVQPLFDHLSAVDPQLGHKAILREIFAQHALPIAFARRDFGAEREEQRKRAAAFADVVHTYHDLAERGPSYDGFMGESRVGRSDLPFVVAQYVFELENVGGASDPIETREGWVVIAAKDVHNAVTSVGDLADVNRVIFRARTVSEQVLWWEETMRAIRNSVTYVHPDYADALPVWLTP